MEIAALIAQFRSEMFDPELPGDGDSSESLWTDAELLAYLDTAQSEYAERVNCFPDSSSFAPAITAGDPYVTADSRIIEVRCARLGSTGQELKVVTQRELDRTPGADDYGLASGGFRWRDEEGTPRFLVTDDAFGKFRLVPKPVENDTLLLDVYRYSLENPSEGVELEIPNERFHPKLLLSVRAQAYRKQDIETHDEQNARRYEIMWENALQAEVARVHRLHRNGGSIAYGGI